jgi:hypothetical protein
MGTMTTIGLDLAKNVFQIHGGSMLMGGSLFDGNSVGPTC